jgi:uridylate kinase
MKEAIVLKFGGSLIYDSSLKVNKQFLTKLIHWYEEAAQSYKHIVLIVGGGTISRHLVSEVEQFGISEEYKHLIGMQLTTANAVMLASLISETDNAFVPRTLGEALEAIVGDKRKLIVSGGFKSGWSTDMDAAVLADVLGINRVHKISNIDHVYTNDPKTDPNARIIKDMTWGQFFTQFNIVPGAASHKPGSHSPVGAYAAQFSARKGISFMVSGGKDLEENEILQIIESGTLIHP